MALSAVRTVQTSEPVKMYSLYIDGKWSGAADGAVADDFNPATGALFARVAQAGRADAEKGPLGEWVAEKIARLPALSHRRQGLS